MKLILAAFLLILFNACTPKKEQTISGVPDPSVASEKNKELVRLVYYEMANKKNYTLIDSFFATNIFDHGAFEGQEQGLQGFKKAVTGFLSMFSQVEIKLEDIVAEGDLVSTRETWKVTKAADKKVLTGETMHWFRIKDGKITDEWSKGWEWLGL